MTFHPGQRKAELSISIHDDEVAQNLEGFSLELEIPPAAAALCVVKRSPATAHVSVVNDG